MKNAMYKILYCFITMFMFSHFLTGHTCLAYQKETHKHIASEALKLVDNPDLRIQAYVEEIKEGSWEADEKFYDSVWRLWRYNDPTAARDHFWNPDTGYAIAPTVYTAYQKASEYWYLAVALYKEHPKDAYTFLGHIAHLLADMSVPAHLLLDPHTGGDSYETYMEIVNNYSKWGAKDITLPIKIAKSGHDLFNNLAQRAQYFPSDDRLGNQEKADPVWFKDWPDPSTMRVDDSGNVCAWWSQGCHVDDKSLSEIRDRLIPLAIEYTASLYDYFYKQVNIPINDGITIPGSIDSQGQINKYPFTLLFVQHLRGSVNSAIPL